MSADLLKITQDRAVFYNNRVLILPNSDHWLFIFQYYPATQQPTKGKTGTGVMKKNYHFISFTEKIFECLKSFVGLLNEFSLSAFKFSQWYHDTKEPRSLLNSEIIKYEENTFLFCVSRLQSDRP